MHCLHRRTTVTLMLAAACGATTSLRAQAQRTPLTIERITATPSILGVAPASPIWSPDSHALIFLWNDGSSGSTARTLFRIDRDGTAPTRVLPATNRGGVSDFVWTNAGDSLYFLQDAHIWRVGARGGEPARVTRDSMDRSDLTLSPDGTQLAFLSDGDLYVMSRNAAEVTRVTSLAVAPIGTVPLGTYFRRDVEIGSATWGGEAPAYAWAPDSRTLAVHIVDRRGVPIMAVPWYSKGRATLNQLRRSAPGEANEVRTIALIDRTTKTLRPISLPDSSSTRIVNFAWSRSGTLLIDRESDDAIDRELLLVNATPVQGVVQGVRVLEKDHGVDQGVRVLEKDQRVVQGVVQGVRVLEKDQRPDQGGRVLDRPDQGGNPVELTPRRIWHDRRTTRIYNDVASVWSADGRQILMTGDLDARYRLYAITPGDTVPRALTTAQFDVIGPAIATARRITYLSNEPLPSERHVWQMNSDGSGRTRITTAPGTHTAFPSPDGQMLALLSTDDVTPTELYLQLATAGSQRRRITRSQPAAFSETPWIVARYITAPARDGLPPLAMRVLLPPNMDTTKKYPVLIGPAYSNTVRNRWAGLYATLQQYLAIEKGYIVVQVDVRGSSGYGRDYREKFLMDWGGADLDDLAHAVAHLKTLPYVDATRFGIWGSSYGGTLTVYSLLKRPGLFAAGVAGAPATDPHFFGSDDVAIARRPQTHPETFTRGALQYAGNLRDHLLIIHGMQDDVVPFATSVALADELMRLGKDFDFAFAPAATHGWTQRPQYARYLLTRLVDHFDRYLGPGPR
jgi:dipeptidyl-peptidase 4